MKRGRMRGIGVLPVEYGPTYPPPPTEQEFALWPWDRQVQWFEADMLCPHIHNTSWQKRLWLGMPDRYPVFLYSPALCLREFRARYITERYEEFNELRDQKLKERWLNQ